ncbi:MAG: sulfotransferase [Bacteroidetes bacterium]|nr:sulfotransferase [Bacteroidota bacterium]
MASSKNNQQQTITFIVGMGRSGTTMLTNMLNLNPNVIACPENEFVMFSFNDFKNKDFTKETVIDEFVNLFEHKFSKIISFWKPGKELKQSILNLTEKSFANVCKQVYLNYPFAINNPENVTCIVDKNPIYSLYLNELNTLFPNSKYIILTRDYRDNALSRKKYSDKETSIYTLGASWNYYYNCIFKSVKKNNLNHYIIRYEDLVNNPSDSLYKLCDFMELSFNDEMLNFQNLAKDIKKYIEQNLPENEYSKLKPCTITWKIRLLKTE